jgi:hypothetical protein
MVYQIFYVSSSKLNSDIESDLSEIVSKARFSNQKNSVTGVLLFRGGIFLQLIEGEKKDVENLYRKIEKDPRHSNLIILFQQESQDRVFPNWDMGLKLVTDLDMKMVNEILSWNKLISASKEIDQHLILHMLKRFKGVE